MKALLAGLWLLWAAPSEAAEASFQPDARQAAIDRLCEQGKRDALSASNLIDEEKRLPGTLTEREAEAFEPYYACRVMAGSGQSCSLLKSLPSARADLYEQCVREAVSAALIDAVLKGRPARAQCLRFVETARVEILPGKADAFCDIYERAIASGDPHCPEWGLVFPAKRAAGCARNSVFIHGDPKQCPPGDTRDAQECRRMAALIGALRGGAAAGCGGSPYCGGLSQAPQSCESLGRDAIAVFNRLECGPREETAQTKARRQREEAEWQKKRSEWDRNVVHDKAQMLVIEEARRAKAEETRKAAEAKTERTRVAAEKERKEQAVDDAKTRRFKTGEPMETPELQERPPVPPQSQAPQTEDKGGAQ